LKKAPGLGLRPCFEGEKGDIPHSPFVHIARGEKFDDRVSPHRRLKSGAGFMGRDIFFISVAIGNYVQFFCKKYV
jgi:hypothetical protein